MSTIRLRHRSGVHRAFQHHAFERFLDAGDSSDAAIATATWAPRVDIKEEAGRFVIHADLPGVDPEAIEVQMDNGVLSIRGERSGPTRGEAGRYAHAERRHGGFHRRFVLPDGADPGGIVARGHNGVLEVAIPKKPASVSRRIPVATASSPGSEANAKPAA